MNPRGRGEPWFLVSLGGFGTLVADALYKDGHYRREWQPPNLSLRVEEGEEHRHGVERIARDDRRRPGVETVRVESEDRENGLGMATPEREPGEGRRLLASTVRNGFIDALRAKNYIERRAAGDDRPITVSVAVVLDFSDGFARAAMAAVLDVLPEIAREVLAPLFQNPYRNLEVVVIGMAPVAEMGKEAVLGTKAALDHIERCVPTYRIGPEGTPDIRVFVVDDRSDRYVLTEKDRVEEVALFAGAIFGAGEPDADPFREIRSPSGERGRREHLDDAIFGTFSVAALSYPGGLVERYCTLRQEYETLQALAQAIGSDADRNAIEPSARTWLAEQTALFQEKVKVQLGAAAKAGIKLREAEFGFVADEQFGARVGYTTPHHELSDPNHRELGWLHEPGFTVGPDGLRQRTYWDGEPEAIERLRNPPGGATGPSLERLSVGVQVVQSEKAAEEAPPRPLPEFAERQLPPDLARRSRWLGRVYGYTGTVLSETIPQFIEAFDASAPEVAVGSRVALRARVDQLLPDGRGGLHKALTWLRCLESAVQEKLKGAREELGAILPERERPPGATRDAEKDWQGKFWSVVGPYHAWRKDLEMRELLRRMVPYSVVAFVLWFLMVFPAAPSIDSRLANPVVAAGTALLFGLLAVGAPAAWDVYDGTNRLRRGLFGIQEKMNELVTWLDSEFYGKRQKLEEKLWNVRWLRLLEDEVHHERNEVAEIRDLLQASIVEVRTELENMGVKFKKLRDETFVVDDDQVFGSQGLFETWHLPEGPPGHIYRRRRTAPDRLADTFLEQTKPFARWREEKPYRSLGALEALVRDAWSLEQSPNPFDGALEESTRTAIRAFLQRFASATRSPLQVSALPRPEETSPQPVPEGEERPKEILPSRRDGTLDWTVFAAAPMPTLKSVLDIAEEVGLDLEPAGQAPMDRIMVVRTLVNVRRNRLEHVLPIGEVQAVTVPVSKEKGS